MKFYMPTKIYIGDLLDFKDEFSVYGKKALIVTGKSSNKNGSLAEVVSILNDLTIAYAIFDEVEENPSIETINKAVKIGLRENVQFIVAIGGGSPLDASKAISVCIKNKLEDASIVLEKVFTDKIPVLAIPTTAGTGSETTGFAILTDHKRKTKIGIKTLVFPDKSFLNYKYYTTLPREATLSTSIDALSHMIEGYLSKNSNCLSDIMAEGGILKFEKYIKNLIEADFTDEFRKEMMGISTIAGMVISSTKTSLPHAFSYNLTYNNHVPHGFACSVFLKEFLKIHKNVEKVNKILSLLGFKNIDEFGSFISKLYKLEIEYPEKEIEILVNKSFENKVKLANHPFEITREDIKNIYENALCNH